MDDHTISNRLLNLLRLTSIKTFFNLLFLSTLSIILSLKFKSNHLKIPQHRPNNSFRSLNYFKVFIQAEAVKPPCIEAVGPMAQRDADARLTGRSQLITHFISLFIEN